jgi:flagellar protein FlaF
MSVNPLDAYQAVEKSTLAGRELEASVLTRSANLLADVRANWNSPELEQRLDDVLRFNQRVWTFFQTEISDPENPLPVEIKKNLLSLSLFIDRRTYDLMAFPSPEKLDVLISINRNVSSGLSGN